jgi:lysophospholipase L1-like esterase
VYAQLVLLGLASIVAACAGGSPTGPSGVIAPGSTAAINYSALGASDANGVGGSVPCVPFTACDDGTGYVPVLVRQLRTTREVNVLNLGMPAAVLGPTVEAIARQLGREVSGNLLDRQMPFVARESTLVTVFAGVNDANIIGEAIENGAAGNDVPAYIAQQARTFGTEYDALIAGIRGRAPNSFVIVLNVPNVAAMPFAQKYPVAHRRVLQSIAVALSRESNRQAANGIVVLDMMCDPATYSPSHFSGDGFHPNDAGYADIARRLAAVVNSGSSSAAPSCAMMSAVS